MRIIPSRVHGIMDYSTGLLMIVSPWLFGFAAGGAETWLMVMFGVASIVYSLFTDYELGTSRTISMKTHLMIDFLSGLLLVISPWLFEFASYVYMPHVIFGIVSMLASLLTEKKPSSVDLRWTTDN